MVVPDWFLPFTQTMFGEKCGSFWKAVGDKGKIAAHPVWEIAVDSAVCGRVLLLGEWRSK
jgi:hypothetical protein